MNQPNLSNLIHGSLHKPTGLNPVPRCWASKAWLGRPELRGCLSSFCTMTALLACFTIYVICYIHCSEWCFHICNMSDNRIQWEAIGSPMIFKLIMISERYWKAVQSWNYQYSQRNACLWPVFNACRPVGPNPNQIPFCKMIKPANRFKLDLVMGRLYAMGAPQARIHSLSTHANIPITLYGLCAIYCNIIIYSIYIWHFTHACIYIATVDPVPPQRISTKATPYSCAVATGKHRAPRSQPGSWDIYRGPSKLEGVWVAASC